MKLTTYILKRTYKHSQKNSERLLEEQYKAMGGDITILNTP